MTEENEHWQVLIAEEIDEAGPASLDDVASVTWPDAYADTDEMMADLGRFDAIVVRVLELDERLLDRADNLKVIAKHGIGLDNVDIDAATERGIVVCNTPEVHVQEVAEHALAMILALRKQLLIADADTRDGVWERNQYETHTAGDDVLGLFGVGNIGRRLAELVQEFGMTCVGYDPYVDASDFPPEVEKVEPKRALFEAADVVSVHTPLTDETHHAISADELRQLPETGLIVNTARGGIIDEAALANALDAGELAGAGLDVFESEPPSSDNPLFEFDTVVVTPHIAGGTVESLQRLSLAVADNIRTVYEDGMPESAVNADGLSE